jgi:KDO2-lipid IV(A) lauroyltransferase
LHQSTRAVLRHAALTYYDFFHMIDRPSAEIRNLVKLDPAFLAKVDETVQASDRGLLVLSTHMSNFDLAGFAFGTHKLPMLGLTVADPTTGFERLNEVRQRFGFDITPITPQSLRAGIRRLKAGGIVATGVDRPIPDDDIAVEFFGKPSFLPAGPARLAALTGARVVIVSCVYDHVTGYRLDSTDYLDLADTGDRKQDIVENTRRFARILEQFISAHPEQWMMFHPLWPDSAESVNS